MLTWLLVGIHDSVSRLELRRNRESMLNDPDNSKVVVSS